ncbi:MAG: hypothetical protein ABUL60_01415 [Myxococcales bacterium]
MTRLARYATRLALGASFGSTALPARAADGGHVRLELHACAELSESALREHLELELSTLGLSKVEARLLLACEPEAVSIELYRDTGERYPVQARVALGDTAKAARARLVALAASELVAQAERARENERVQPPPAPRKSSTALVDSQRAPVAPAVTSPRHRPIELLVAGNVALVGVPRATLWGGSLGARWGVTRAWSVLVDTRFERGEERLGLADVRWTSLSGFVGADLGTHVGPVRLSGGFGVRAGWLALSASAAVPNEGLGFTAPWAGVAVPLRAAFDMGGFVSPFFGCEGGYVLAPVRGKVDDGSVLMEQRGGWLAGSVGVAITL